MSDDQIRRAMVQQFNLRIGPNMTQYVRRQLLGGDAAQVPVMGGDARTGVAVRQIVALHALKDAAADSHGAGETR